MRRRLSVFLRLAGVAWCGVAALVARDVGAQASALSAQPTPGFLGFDARVYPGDSAMQAWRFPASPYRWIGYYLPAPCHPDSSFVGKYSRLATSGWGVAAIYVGEQDWANAPSTRSSTAPMDSTRKSTRPLTCSATLVTGAQGAIDAADAVERMRADGFPIGSTIFLDLERVDTVSPALVSYYRAWVAGVLKDGRYKPGVYATKANAPALHDAEIRTAKGSLYVPPFWIASAGAIDSTTKPADIGLDYAHIWQSSFNVTQTFNGVALRIDVNVATKPNPSAP